MVTEQASNGTRVKSAVTRLPGLDGVRALAVIAVIAFHEQLPVLPGGFLGVDVFFVLSGYLITDLLVAQWQQYGRLRLGNFWARRGRRLLPALATMLVVVTAATAIIEPSQLAALRPALLAAVTYSSNWWQALHHQSYFTQFGPPPPLQHLWSLAIEEQFYLVWPVLLIVLLRRCRSSRLRASAAWLCAALSALATVAIYLPGADPSRVYYGTDTHSSALLIGAALALSWPLQRLRALTADKARVADGLGLAGLALLGWAMGHYRGGTNGSFTAAQLHQLLGIIGPSRELVLVNTYEARPWEAADNRLIDTAARQYPNVFLANWFATIDHRTSLLWPDEVHPQPSGARVYARTVAAAVRSALAAGPVGTPTGPPLAHHLRPAS
jgi:peptidoglycan/LPS O-acetylase OafA/YrhL